MTPDTFHCEHLAKWAASLPIRDAAPPDAAARRVAAAAAEVVSVLEKHISQLQDAE